MFQIKYQLDDGTLVESMCPDFRIRRLLEGFKAYPTCGFRHSKTVVNEHGHVIGWIEIDEYGSPKS